MANVRLAPRVPATRAKRGGRIGRRPRRRRNGWLIAAKVAFLLERRRRRRNKEGSSPSLRQIALIVVSAGLAILVIRVASARIRSHAGQVPADTTPETPTTGEGPSNDSETPTTDAGPSNDSATATESPLTDTVQTEMSRRDDTPAPATGSD